MYQTTTITPNVGGSSLNLGYSYYDPQPEAHITKSKNRLKLYSGSTVYLKDESTFEIELYNPKPVRVLAKISLNGLYISGGGIIVNPGQRVYLERFIDEDRRFKFSTYEVEDSDEARQAIEKNGEVRVEFYSELNLGTQYMQYSSFTAPPVYAGSTVNTLFNTSASLTSSVTYDASVKGSMETGRVEKGSRSSQELAAGFGSAGLCGRQFQALFPGGLGIGNEGDHGRPAGQRRLQALCESGSADAGSRFACTADSGLG